MSKKHIFTPIEKKIFLDILKKYSNIIENKNTDGASLSSKKEAWTKLTAEYNASPQVTAQVTCQQVRRLWANLKQRQREALTKERQHRLATGGGPSTSDAIIDPEIAQIAPALIIGINEAIDSDSTTVSEMAVTEAEILIETEPTPSTPPPSYLYIPSPLPSSSSVFTDLPPPPSPRTQPPPPPIVISPPPSVFTLPPPPTPSSQNTSFQRTKISILEKEYNDRNRRAEEIHNVEVLLLKEKIREAKAKANLSELILERNRSSDYTIILDNHGDTQ